MISLLCLVLIWVGRNAGQAENLAETEVAPSADQQNISAEIDDLYGWQSLIQTVSLERNSFEGRNAIGIHARPAWRWGRFDGTFDIALFQNPWNENRWQWGTPRSDTKPDVPNFVDSLAYHDHWLEMNYQKINDLDFGYGLLINDYHPLNPYHGFAVKLTPSATTQLSYVASNEVVYLAPFVKNDWATLQVWRLDQSLDTAGLHWQLGLTGVHDSYPQLTSNQFPTGGASADISLTNVIWCAPFWETADFDHYGRANMVGVKGRLGLISYQLAPFFTRGKFIANYFGGRYEDLKWNSFNNAGEEGLLSLDEVGDSPREGTMAQLWVQVSPWLNMSCLHVDDLEDSTVYCLSGKIERLGLQYSFSFYNQAKNDYNYEWYIMEDNDTWSYQCHYYRDLDSSSRWDFEVGYKF